MPEKAKVPNVKVAVNGGFDMSNFDEAAAVAEKELLANIKKWTAVDVAEWWKKHFMKAGHKRLGRILLKAAKNVG